MVFVLQLIVTATITQYAQDLGLTKFWMAVLGLIHVALGGALVFLPRIQGDGVKRSDDVGSSHS